MKIRYLFCVISLLMILVPPVVQSDQFDIPVADQARDNGQAPYNSPVIDEDWTSTRYYVFSEDASLKAEFGFFHELPGAFSAALTPEQVTRLKISGISVEPVPRYNLIGKPVCGDGICQGNESRTCSEDCSEAPEPDPGRTCSPDNQFPWGIIRVNGGGGGAGVFVAVLDSGIKADHPDLKDNIVGCVDSTKRGIKQSCSDNVGHGTHVAGTIAANGSADGLGIYGVAPDASILGIKVCRTTSCWGDDIAEGIYYATDRQVNIVSMSLSGDLPDPFILQAIDYADANGVLVIAAAGNDGPDTGSIDYPAAYHKAVAVGATNVNEAVPSFSSRGINDGDYIIEENEIEFAAPGVSVESTYNDGCYIYMSGTSMATPHISGLAAVLWQGDAIVTRSLLRNAAVDIWTIGDDTATGYGLVIAP
jgi:subtilisin